MNKEITFYPKKRSSVLLFCFSLLFVLLGMWLVTLGSPVGWLTIILFGIGCIVFLLTLLPSSFYLQLNEDGFWICGIFRKGFTRWVDVDQFVVDQLAPGQNVVMFNYAPNFNKYSRVRKLSRTIAGFDAALPDNYGKSADELVVILNEWKNKSVGKVNDSTSGQSEHRKITLSENELVAFIGLLMKAFDRIPKVPEGGSAAYSPDPRIQSRFGLRQQYTLDEMNSGLESLKKRNLAHPSLFKINPDDFLSGLVGTVILNQPNEHQQYYDKHFGIIVSFTRTADAQYVFTLISQVKPARKPIVPILIIVGAISLIVFTDILAKITNLKPESLAPVQPTNNIEINQEALGDNSLAYVKNGNLFLADKNGVEQITSGHKVSNLKVSSDGKYLGWIEKKDFTIEDRTNRNAGYAISLINLATLEITYDAIGPLSFVSNDDIHRKEIMSFDYLNTNPLTIVYTADGVWRKDFSTNKNEKLFNNDYGKENSPLDDKRYSSVVVNNKLNTLSLTTGGWEWCKNEFYDIRQTKLTSIEDGGFCQGIWSNDGKSFFVYSSYGMKEGGLWQIDAVNGKLIKNIFDPRLGLTVSVDTLDILDNGSLIASLKPIDSEGNKNQSFGLSLNGTSIYQIDDIAQPRPRFIKQANVLLNYHYNSSPIKHLDNNEISYLSNNAKNQNTYDLYVIDLNGKNDQEIVKGISDYVWIPKNEKQATTVSNKTYTNDKYGFSFEYPSEFSQRAIKDTDYSFILSTESVTLSTVDGNAQYYKKNIGWKIKPNANNFKSIRDWFVNNFSYDNWQEVEKDPTVSEEIRSNVNVISHKSSSAEYFIIDSFVMLNDGQVLELATSILSTDGKSEPSEEVVGEEIYNLIINSFSIK